MFECNEKCRHIYAMLSNSLVWPLCMQPNCAAYDMIKQKSRAYKPKKSQALDKIKSLVYFAVSYQYFVCLPFFFSYSRDFDFQLTFTNSCHLSVFIIYVLDHTNIIVIIVYKFIMWLFCSERHQWLENKAFVVVVGMKISKIKQAGRFCTMNSCYV